MANPTRELLRELIELRKQGASKVIDIRTDDVTTTLAMSRGEIVAVQASRPGEPLARLLVRKRLLEHAHYVDVLERMSAALGVGEKVRFGELAVELGYVKEEAVRECLSEQLRWLVARVFHRPDPTWRIGALPGQRDTSRDVSIHIEAAFLDAVRWMDDARKGALGLDEARAKALRPIWPVDEIDVRFDLTEDEAEIVRVALAGDRTVDEVLEGNVPDNVDAPAVLAALIASAAAESRARGAAEKHAKSTRGTRAPGTSPPAEPPRAVINASRAKDALAKISLANISLSKGSASAMNALDASVERRLRAEQALLRGKYLFSKADTKNAVAHFERAAQLAPDSSEIDLFVRWSRHVTSEEVLDADQRADLERRAREALDDEPKLAFGFFVLGEMLHEGGKSEEARRQLRHALRLEPTLFEGVRARRLEAMRTPSVEQTLEAEPLEQEKHAPPGLPEEATEPEQSKADAIVVPLSRTSEGEPGRSRGGIVAIAFAVVVLAAGAVVYCTVAEPKIEPATATTAGTTLVPMTDPNVGPAPLALANAAEAVTTDTKAASADASLTTDVVDAGTADASSDESALDAKVGVLLLPKSAISHRVFVDRRVVISEVGPDTRLVVPCGTHEVRIGSQGRAMSVVVPCGGETMIH